jgi:electron transport complex protein RnfB
MLLAKIREVECVGCGKCLAVCPVDAIIGAPKLLYSILDEECIGCKLCVAPCPMDCIEMWERADDTPTLKIERAHKAKARYQARQQRLLKEAPPKLIQTLIDPAHKTKVQQEIAEAVQRVKSRLAKKNHRNL